MLDLKIGGEKKKRKEKKKMKRKENIISLIAKFNRIIFFSHGAITAILLNVDIAKRIRYTNNLVFLIMYDYSKYS